MASVSTIENFSGVSTDWDTYIERLEQHFIANDLEEIQPDTENGNAAAVQKREKKRRAILLSVIGTDTYSVLRNLCLPEKPADKTYTDITKVLKNHFAPTPSETVQRFRFHTRCRSADESVAEYVAELRKLAENCNFGVNLEEMLRDRLVCGINEDKIQRLLLLEDKLTLDRAFKIACAHELAITNSKVLQGKEMLKTEEHVNKVKLHDTKKNKNRKCYRCGDTSHLADKCRHTDSTCNYCKKVGHIVRACFKKKRDSERLNEVNMTEGQEDEEELQQTVVYSIASSNPPIYLDVIVNDIPVNFQLDTGAGVSVMNHTQFESTFSDIQLKKSEIVLKSYSSNRIPVVGEVEVSAAINGSTCKLTLVVVEGNGPPLLGRTWLKRLNIPWTTMFQISSAVTDGNSAKKLDKSVVIKDMPLLYFCNV